jgi:hypothetical protein
MADTSRKSDKFFCTILRTERFNHSRAELCRRGKNEYVMLLGCRVGIEVEMVNNKASAVGGDSDVEFGKKADNSSGDGRIRRESNKDVAVGIREIEQGIWCQVRAKAWLVRD